MESNVILKTVISISALSLVAVHALRPEITVDAITLGLLILAALPWLSAIIESAELPGGWKVKFRDVQAAGQKVAYLGTGFGVAAHRAPYGVAAERDPNLALVALRIEIEKRLRALAERNGLPPNRPLSQLVNIMRARQILPIDASTGLQELIVAGNSAAHGARVEPSVAQWAMEFAPMILGALDALLENEAPGV